jgi:hypothetical protein
VDRIVSRAGLPGPGRKPRKRKSRQAFLACIYRIWQLRYVDVPREVAAELAKEFQLRSKPTKYIPVVAQVKGRAVPTTLLPAGGGRYRMQFNAQLRKAARADTGELVRVELSPDRQSREIPVPADLWAALRQHPTARRALENAPPGYRRQILKWMDSAKGDRARERRIAAVLDRMLERAILGPNRRTNNKE